MIKASGRPELAENRDSTGGVLSGDTLVAGKASAEKLVVAQPLSFWGGYDSTAGRIVDRSHPLVGQSLAGKIMVMEHAKGSSSSSSVLAEALRNGTGPVGIILRERDLIISIGAIIAAELYSIEVPVVSVSEQTYKAIIDASGPLRIDAVEGIGGARIYPAEQMRQS
jgi:uncharacterized protein